MGPDTRRTEETQKGLGRRRLSEMAKIVAHRWYWPTKTHSFRLNTLGGQLAKGNVRVIKEEYEKKNGEEE